MQEAYDIALRLGRKDFQSEDADELASVYISRLELDRAAPLVEQAILLAEQSGSAEARGRALRVAGQLHLHRRELDDAEAALEAAREHLAEAGAAWALGRTIHFAAWVARYKGEPARAERLYRESIRILSPLEDRATLCESQRGLAELLLAEGRIDEAERFAIAARETVGPEDVTSLSTTASTLGKIRAAQGRDDEAEPLLREAFDIVAECEHRMQQRDALEALAQFLRDRGREDEAVEVAERRERVLAEAESAARIA
jgi:tetratricopeptide (TPR) repeat protein